MKQCADFQWGRGWGILWWEMGWWWWWGGGGGGGLTNTVLHDRL